MSEAVIGARASRLDVDHLLSRTQIEIVKSSVNKGDYIKFQNGEEKIEGIVSKKYEHIFMLDNGRTYSWIDYITGSPEVLSNVRRYYPAEEFVWDPTLNYYRMKMARTD